jgi:hypothetical protein
MSFSGGRQIGIEDSVMRFTVDSVPLKTRMQRQCLRALVSIGGRRFPLLVGELHKSCCSATVQATGSTPAGDRRIVAKRSRNRIWPDSIPQSNTSPIHHSSRLAWAAFLVCCVNVRAKATAFVRLRGGLTAPFRRVPAKSRICILSGFDIQSPVSGSLFCPTCPKR